MALAALVAAFGQVTFGGVVRVSGAGLGCPDWPLCHGQLVPPFDTLTLIEYSHRLFAALVGLLVLGTAALAWVSHRKEPWVFVPSALGLILVVVAAALGGLTVLSELAWWWIIVHLAVAEVLVACLIIAVVAGWKLSPRTRVARAADGEAKPAARVFVRRPVFFGAAAGVFILLMSGSYMVGFGAGSSCATWPLCRGAVLPGGEAYAIHMAHRFLAAAVGFHLIATVRAAWSLRGAMPEVAWAGGALAGAFALQVMVGAIVVWAGFAAETKAIHLSAATLVWIAVVFLLALVLVPGRDVMDGGLAVQTGAQKLRGSTP